MKKLTFKNSNGWNSVSAELCGEECTRLSLADGMVEEISLDFDERKNYAVRFLGGEGEQSGLFYPGSLSMGIEYKKNLGMDRDLTYLISDKVSGHVDNYVLEDAENLSHRADKSKKISVFVPSTYDGNTPHDILYFFDAQNLFCSAGEYTTNGDPYGSWQLDTVLCALHDQYGKNIIVVGIDNADEYRSQELFMNHNSFGKLAPLATAIPEDDFSHGYLDGLSAFMTGKLHAFIKEKYLVKEDNIGIGGSSMGGIASFYCAMRELGFYKYVLSYSPAFGLYEMSAFDGYFAGKNFCANLDTLPKIHIYCGGGDMLEEMLLPAAKGMKPLLVSHGYPADRLFETYDDEKPHNEESWRLILPQSFSYLCF